MKNQGRQLIFENGRQFFGIGFGAAALSVAEVVFNTAMVGYQEIVSDPVYCGTMVCMTYPLIGNYGLADEDYESRKPFLSGLIVRECNDTPSNFRYTRTLDDLLVEHGIPGIAGVDTRAITRMLRDEGSMRAVMTGADMPVRQGLERLAKTAPQHNQVARVTSRKLWYARTANPRFNVAAVDFGIRFGVIRALNALGCNLTILPASATAEQVRGLRPDGLLLSGGPGDPKDVPQGAALVRALQGTLPIAGIGLGQLVIALANGAKATKLKFGHRGSNHPVRDLRTGKIAITAQNHGYAVDAASLEGTPLALTHVDLLDGTVEGIADEARRLFAVQYDPETTPGAQATDPLFARFIAAMEAARQEKEGLHAQA